VEETANNVADIQEKYSITDDFVYHLGDGEFVMPGFIDTHIHASQYPNAGIGYDMQLLDWLTTYTFPLEMKYSDLSFAEKVYKAVVVSNQIMLSSKGHLWNFAYTKEYIF
jgi:guanine deaminase